MSILLDAFQFVKDWFNQINPDDRAKVEDIESGLRAPLVGSTDKRYVTSPCQYLVKGLSAVCKYWSDTTSSGIYSCSFVIENSENTPSGYGVGFCDGLGRREWCSKYEASGPDNLEEYVCVLPCLEKSGFGKQKEDESGYVSLVPFAISEIKGYNNEDGSSVGRCDGKGMGRGSAGFDISDILELYKKRPVCRHYRPWSMGFGAVVPRPAHEVLPTTLEELHDGSPSDPLVPMERRLPFAFDVYNHRARFQKCVHWNSDFGLPFSFNEHSGAIALEDDPASLCSCSDEASIPYKTISADWPENVKYVLIDVWAEYGGVVCNGAKPECPCYTGKWKYCVDDYMRDGMRITANQILELRFWTSDWESQKDYDDYFKNKPGPTSGNTADETTSDIYTFTYWEKLNPTDPNESVMVGMKQNICVPVPLNNRVFDPEVYITKEQIKYPKIQEFYGTHGPGEVAFPTLVRELESAENMIPALDIIYPYSSKNPWDLLPCSTPVDDVCVHSCNQMILPGPTIGVLGYSVRNKEIFIINVNLVETHPVLLSMLNYKRVDKVPYNKRDAFNLEISDLLKQLDKAVDKDTFDGFKQTKTDDMGFFELGSVKLRYEQTNTLIIICKYDDNNNLYNFRVRKVLSKYYGGYIKQTEFTYDVGESSSVFVPTGFYPAPTLGADIIPINGKIGNVFSVFSFYFNGIYDNYVTMSYCINEYTDEVVVTKWTQVGITNYILAEIDNVDLSYVFDFQIVTATLDYVGTEKTTICGGSNKIDIEYVSSVDGSSLISRYGIPPNALLLKSDSVVGFSNDDWTLTIKYKYQKLENFIADDGEAAKVSWPSGIKKANEGYYRFIDSPYSVVPNDPNNITSFTVGGAHSAAFAVMAYIVDEEMRIQSATATKLLSCINYSGCRNVDIDYKYAVDAVGYEPQPNYGFFTWRGADRVLTDANKTRIHSKSPLCGDHECAPENCVGPMWFPYDNCTTVDYYNVYTPTAQCTTFISEGDAYIKISPAGWRYCQAPEYEAWCGLPGSNAAAACGGSFTHFYSKADLASMRFTGKARIRGPISVSEYLTYGWALPPFGNTGREYTERWLSKDYTSYIDLSSNPVRTRAEYMPHVIDDTDIFLDFNCFSRANWHGPINEPFSHLSQLNLFNALWVNETIDDSARVRFEDTIEIIKQSPCSYPPPGYGDNDVLIKRYGFKDEKTCWMWQEWWEDIDRHSENKLLFLKLERPEYVYDYDKKECRLITDEGEHLITFIPPLKYEYDLINTGTEYSGVYLDSADNQRFFKIIYNDSDYLSTDNVEWMDEGTVYEHGSNPIDGEGGAWGFLVDVWSWISNVGDSAETVVWAHDVNTLFDTNASAGKNEDRKIVMSEDSAQDKYFNRGIITNISKKRLEYLPLLELDFSATFDYNNTCTITQETLRYNVPIKVIITGKWGKLLDENTGVYTNYCLPSVTVAEHYRGEISITADHTVGTFSGKDSRRSYTEGSYGKLYDYEIVLELSKLPTHIMKEVDFFTITLGITPDEEIEIESLDGVMAYYTQLTESLKIYERKYICSTLDGGDVKNSDGPQTADYRAPSPANKGNGQYFPTATSVGTSANEIKTADKMTMVGASKFYIDNPTESTTRPLVAGGGSGSWDGGGIVVVNSDAIKESGLLDVTLFNLKTIEKEEQKKLYKDALDRDAYDILILNSLVPIKFKTFLNKIGLNSSINKGKLTIKSNKLLWENHNLVKRFIQDGLDFFHPGGHYFTWADYIYKTRCTIFGPVETVYSILFVHHLHGKSTPTTSALDAYAGWVRIAYYEGRLAQITGAQPPNVDLVTRANM